MRIPKESNKQSSETWKPTVAQERPDEGQSPESLTSFTLTIFPLHSFIFPPSRMPRLKRERGHHTSFLRDSVIFSLTSFASPESFWVLRKGTECLGPNGKERALEEGHCHWVEGTLQARPWPGAWSWEVSQRFIFCFFLVGFPVSEVVAEGSWGLPGLYK